MVHVQRLYGDGVDGNGRIYKVGALLIDARCLSSQYQITAHPSKTRAGFGSVETIWSNRAATDSGSHILRSNFFLVFLECLPALLSITVTAPIEGEGRLLKSGKREELT